MKNLKHHLARALGGAVLAAAIAPAAAAPAVPDVDTIVRDAEQAAYFQGRDGRARVSMKITDGQGRERRRRMVILRLDGAEGSGDQKYYLYLRYPSDVKDTVLMVWKKGAGDDDRWLYLPALDLVKRITAGDKRTSFLGSDFFYEDISGRSMAEDSHQLTEVTDNYFVVRHTPRQPDGVEFSHYDTWIHRGTGIPVKAEFHDRQGKPYRVYDALKVETVQGHPTVTVSRMRDLRSGSETTLEFSRVSYDLDLPDDLFTERNLRTPPTAYLR